MVFNLLSVVSNLSSFVIIVPFIELLFGKGQAARPDRLEMDSKTLSDWLSWQLGEWKMEYGIWRCLAVVALLYLASSLLSNLFRYAAAWYLSTIRNGVIEHLRNDIYHKITILPVSFFKRRRTGDILSRMSNDISDIEWSVVCSIQSMIKSPINIVVFAATLVFISLRLFIYFLLIVPVVVLLVGLVGKSLKRNSTKGQNALGGLFSIIEETIANIRVVKAFGGEERQVEAFRRANTEYRHRMDKVVTRKELSSPLSEILGTVALAAVVVIGGSYVINGGMAPSVFILFVIVFARIIPPVQAMVKAYSSIQKGNASAGRLMEIMDAEEVIEEKPDARRLEGFRGEIEYRDVGFAHDDGGQQVLEHVSLTIAKGKTVALIGPSGAGKTTIVDLLSRFYDVGSGEIVIDGTDIRDLNIDSLRSQIAIVTQDCLLFNDSVANNIAFGKQGATMDEIRQAARQAFADDFIAQLPQGYDTIVGDKGMALSGGQRQRISIARAILKNAPILVLDEATSALDSESEQKVKEALEALMEDRTTIVVAHRLSTIRHADCIYVLDQGKIVESGTHEQLMERDSQYKHMLEMQKVDVW